MIVNHDRAKTQPKILRMRRAGAELAEKIRQWRRRRWQATQRHVVSKNLNRLVLITKPTTKAFDCSLRSPS